MDWESRIPPRVRQEGRLRLGAVPFLYAEPLVYGLRGREDLELVRAMPGTLASDLERGRVAAALVPVLEAARHPRVRILPGLGVRGVEGASDEWVLSRVAPSEIRTLAIRGEDGGVGAVARILLAESYGARPRMAQAIEEADAVVLAGDAGLREDRDWAHVLDVGELWERHTGVPQVLAVWAVGDAASVSQVRAQLVRSAQMGLENLTAIAGEAVERLGIDRKTAEAYLSHPQRYRLDGAAIESIRRLVAYGGEYGFCAPGATVTLC